MIRMQTMINGMLLLILRASSVFRGLFVARRSEAQSWDVTLPTTDGSQMSTWVLRR